MRVVITPHAAASFREEIAYYSRQGGKPLAKRFRDEFKNAQELLARMPGIGSREFSHIFKTDIRTWPLDKFPFRLFYETHGDVLRILALDHQSRPVTPDTLSPS